MKLYTRSEIIKMLDFFHVNDADIIQFVDTLEPVVLPTDEEIEDKGKWVFNDAGHTIYTHYNTVPSWVAGAKWMRDKIKGGDE